MSEVSVGALINELRRIKLSKNKLTETIAKLEMREDVIVEELHKFYTTPPDSQFEILIILKRPI